MRHNLIIFVDNETNNAFYMKRIFIGMLLLAFSTSVFAQQTPNYELASRFTQKKIGQMVFSTSIRPNWFKESDKFWYSWRTPAGTNYYVVDAATGQKTELFNMEKLAMELTTIVRDPFDAQHIPMNDLKLKDDKTMSFNIKSKLCEPDSTFYFEYDIASRKLKTVKKGEKSYPQWANVSPDGKVGVFAKNGNLYWMDEENLKKAAKDEKDTTLVEHKLTTDGTREFGYGFGNYKGNTQTDTTKRSGAFSIVWSPDSRYFATYKYDMSMVKEMWVINSLSNPRPTLETYKYQLPGEPGPKEYLYIFDLKENTNKTVKLVAFKDQQSEFFTKPYTRDNMYKKYHSSVWLGDDKGFYMLRQSRDQKRLDVCRVDLDSDSTKTVITERMNTYVESRNIRLIKNGSQIIQWSERNGWANLYLYNADGTLVKNLTEGAFHVEDVLGINEKENYLIFSACGVNKGENPYQMHTYRVSLDGGPIKQLDMDDMDVKASVVDNAKYFIANYSRVDAVPAVALIDRNGKKVELETADLSLLFEAGYKLPERFTVKAADGVTDLYGVMYKPFDFDETKQYPIIEYVYPGPQVEANNISWSSGMVRTDRLAQLGFIVITVGNRGGHPNRSKWYHNYGYGNLRDYGLEDQKTAVQKLAARHPWIDATRVGIHGHSGGGFMSTAAILQYPDFYTAAVSCAGNHDNRIYNRWWSEQHHGVLEKITEDKKTQKSDTTFVYKMNTNAELAGRLKGHLLLVHGDMDDNVHPGNTTRVVNALIRANKRFDMLYLPGQRHGFGDMNEYFFWRLADYFSEHLLGTSQRDQVDIIQMNND